tara:strand:+ start:262 stop:465 length:204 start_codon:yes stop_codon:yes gene_type:complete
MSKDEKMKIQLELISICGDTRDTIKEMKALEAYITPNNIDIHKNMQELIKKLLTSIELISNTVASMK